MEETHDSEEERSEDGGEWHGGRLDRPRLTAREPHARPASVPPALELGGNLRVVVMPGLALIGREVGVHQLRLGGLAVGSCQPRTVIAEKVELAGAMEAEARGMDVGGSHRQTFIRGPARCCGAGRWEA